MATSPAVDVHVHPTRYSPLGARFAERNRIEYSVGGLLAELDREGVGSALFLAPRLAPSPAEALREAADVERESGGRLLPTATVDPTGGVEAVEEALRWWSRGAPRLRAVKLYPGYQPFAVPDPRVEPILAWAERARVPVFVHQGDTSEVDARVRFAMPIHLDEVAVRWRGVRFVLCHLGNPWMEEAAAVVRKNPNVWADTSGLLNPFVERFDELVDRMRRRLAHALWAVGDARKILFGSDWPISTIRDARALVDPLDLTVVDRERILGGNARELLGIGPANDS
ncbi:MAG TPA: amidohydrolase family protein [Thermoplasmata archaeon]|nr:amidohydrolase family protein [Thermoplasmata archaeon]